MTWKIQVTKVQPYRLKRKKFLKSGFKQLTRWKHSALRPTSTGCLMPAASTMLLTYSWIALCCRVLITSWRGLLIESPMPSRVRWAQMSWLMCSRTISRCLATRILQLGNVLPCRRYQRSTAVSILFRLWAAMYPARGWPSPYVIWAIPTKPHRWQ